MTATPSALLENGDVRPALVPYLRVSTDDKGQDPIRQLRIIAPWAEREGFILLKPEVDELSGSKVEALRRPGFLTACKRAQAAGATGIVLESPDRFSRMDPIVAVWEMKEVKDRYGLNVYFAGIPLSYQASAMGKLVIFLQMASAHQWILDHTSKVLSGMAGRKANGAQFGRKRKKLTDDEILFVVKRRTAGGGWEKIAVDINEQRKVHEMTNKALAYERMVSAGSLRRMAAEGDFGDDEMMKLKKPEQPYETIHSPSQPVAVGEEVVSSGPEGSP